MLNWKNDVLELEFIDPKTNKIVGKISTAQAVLHSMEVLDAGNTDPAAISNGTSFNLEKDFFIAPNGFTFTVEDSRAVELNKKLQIGFKVRLKLNCTQTTNPGVNFIGYVFEYRLTYSRDGGSSLRIVCKDLLEYMAQGSIYPNLGVGAKTQFHFTPNTTFSTAFKAIADSFSIATGVGDKVILGRGVTPGAQQITIQTDDSANLTFASGGKVGLKVKGKTPKSRSKSLSEKMKHFTSPQKGESYFAYMDRIAKHIGCDIKMSDTEDNVILIAPPTYNRTEQPPFRLVHFVKGPDTKLNNVVSASYKFNLDQQPSVVIAEGNGMGDSQYRQTDFKGIAINELTAFKSDLGVLPEGQALVDQALKAVNEPIKQMTTGVVGTGYRLAEIKQNLYDLRAAIQIDVDTSVSMPHYFVDTNALNNEEVLYAAAKLLAQCQDKYLEAEYIVAGWSFSPESDPSISYIWQPNMLVSITEEALTPGNPKTFVLWIRRVNYVQTREGTETHLLCTLPFTHDFEISL